MRRHAQTPPGPAPTSSTSPRASASRRALAHGIMVRSMMAMARLRAAALMVTRGRPRASEAFPIGHDLAS